MKKIFYLSSFYFIIGLMVNLTTVKAIFAEEEKQVKIEELEEVAVSATKIEREVKKIPTQITVLTFEDIQKYDAKDLSEVLRQIPGFNISYFGSVHADVYVSSRGNQPLTRGALLLVNGIEYNNPSGYFNVLAIPIGEIEKIEIVKSPVTSLYGNLATGGIVHVITKKPTKPFEISLSLSHGSFETKRYYGIVKGLLDKFEYYIEGRYLDSEGWQKNSWEENKLLNVQLKYNFDKLTNIGFHFNYAPIKNGYPGPISEEQFKKDPRQTNQPWGIGDSYTLLFAPYFEKTFKNSKLIIKTKYGQQDGYCIDPDYFDFYNYNFISEINYSYFHKIGNLPGIFLAGVEYRYLNNKKIKAYTVSEGKKVDLYQDRKWKDKTLALFIQEEIIPFENFILLLGLRYDHVKTDFIDKINPFLNFDRSDSAFSPRLGIVYNFSEKFNIFANYSKGFRTAATVTTAFVNNPKIKPEKIHSYELGVRGKLLEGLYYYTSLFLIDTFDKIVRVGGPRRVDSAGKTRSIGLELGIDLKLNNGFYGWLNYTFQESKFKKYTTVTGISYKEKEIPLIPKHLLGIGVGYKNKVLGNLYININYSSKRYVDVANIKTLGQYWTIDAKYMRPIGKNVEIFLSGKNLTDERYAEVGFGGEELYLYPMPGRSIIAGILFRY